MMGRTAETDLPVAGGRMCGISRRAEGQIGGVDEKIAVLAEQIGVVAEGDARARLQLRREAPAGSILARVEVVDAGLRRVDLARLRAADRHARGPDAAADIRR